MSHALLSPSGAARWLACTPSARLESKFADKSSPAAAEGTLAHRLAELLISIKLGVLTDRAEIEAAAIAIKADPLYESAMWDYTDTYATYVVEQFATAQAHTKDAVIYLERKLDLTEYVPDGFGTGDVVIIADGTLRIIDLKYGKGVPVYAPENKQMMLYALGALREFDIMYDINTIEMTIYQPRLDTISVWELPVVELRKWAEEVLRPRAKLAFEGKGEYRPGDHCRFCKAKATCRALAEWNLEIAKYDFADGNTLTDDEVADILTRADSFLKWIEAVQDNALDQAVNKGKRWPGYKLVEGRSNRVYTDKVKVAETLITEGFKEDQIYEPKTILGITALEKVVGKKVFNDLLSPLIAKPAGKPTLVPASDKRPELNSIDSAVNDFS